MTKINLFSMSVDNDPRAIGEFQMEFIQHSFNIYRSFASLVRNSIETRVHVHANIYWINDFKLFYSVCVYVCGWMTWTKSNCTHINLFYKYQYQSNKWTTTCKICETVVLDYIISKIINYILFANTIQVFFFSTHRIVTDVRCKWYE